MNRQKEKRKRNREKGKRPVLCLCAPRRPFVRHHRFELADGMNNAFRRSTSTSSLSCRVCWVEEKKNRRLGFAWSKEKNQSMSISTPNSIPSLLLLFCHPLFAHPFSSSFASASGCSSSSCTRNDTLISSSLSSLPPLHHPVSCRATQSQRHAPGLYPTLPVLEYDELSMCPHAYPATEAP